MALERAAEVLHIEAEKYTTECTMMGFMEQDLRKLDRLGWSVNQHDYDDNTYFVYARKFIRGCEFTLFSGRRSNANKS